MQYQVSPPNNRFQSDGLAAAILRVSSSYRVMPFYQACLRKAAAEAWSLEIAIWLPMNEFFLAALSFGLAAGLKPGPLGFIVIQQTLSRGLSAGVRASLAPLITDGPIIIAALWFLSQFKSLDLFAAALSLVGGAYLLWLAAKMFRVSDISLPGKLTSQNSLATAVKVNLLNPGPYLFWFTVGGSYIIRGSTAESLVFVVTSIGTLIASKIAVAVLAVRFFPSLESRGYLLTMKFLAGILVWFGLLSVVRAAEFGLHYARNF